MMIFLLEGTKRHYDICWAQETQNWGWQHVGRHWARRASRCGLAGGRLGLLERLGRGAGRTVGWAGRRVGRLGFCLGQKVGLEWGQAWARRWAWSVGFCLGLGSARVGLSFFENIIFFFLHFTNTNFPTK